MKLSWFQRVRWIVWIGTFIPSAGVAVAGLVWIDNVDMSTTASIVLAAGATVAAGVAVVTFERMRHAYCVWRKLGRELRIELLAAGDMAYTLTRRAAPPFDGSRGITRLLPEEGVRISITYPSRRRMFASCFVRSSRVVPIRFQVEQGERLERVRGFVVGSFDVEVVETFIIDPHFIHLYAESSLSYGRRGPLLLLHAAGLIRAMELMAATPRDSSSPKPAAS